jgi:hypothetical protein
MNPLIEEVCDYLIDIINRTRISNDLSFEETRERISYEFSLVCSEKYYNALKKNEYEETFFGFNLVYAPYGYTEGNKTFVSITDFYEFCLVPNKLPEWNEDQIKEASRVLNEEINK